MNQLKALLTLACLVAASPALAQRYMDFGGMYGYSGESSATGVYGNPYANNTDGCPSGYTAYQVYGRPGPVDHPLYLCGRITAGHTTPVADFGGMWSTFRPNHFTGGYSCPAGYTQTQVLGTYNVDYPLYYCHRPAAANPQFRLGGMYSYYYSTSTGPDSGYYPNAVLATGKLDACPSGFTKSEGMAAPNDGGLYWCHQTLY
ncbi:MAG TPA: hypothetical protein VEU33_28170 [Archangium sp.]|nr:hypothetical protein [Archangium sp.]